MRRYARNQMRIKESSSQDIFIKKSNSNSTNKSSMIQLNVSEILKQAEWKVNKSISNFFFNFLIPVQFWTSKKDASEYSKNIENTFSSYFFNIKILER